MNKQALFQTGSIPIFELGSHILFLDHVARTIKVRNRSHIVTYHMCLP